MFINVQTSGRRSEGSLVEPFKTFSSRIVAIPIDNIDTDQIIPARYLKTTDKAGLGEGLFSDWRYDAEGRPRPDFVLNQPGSQGGQALLAGDNFGCGSSREHAPWALTGFGLRAVISTSFADIFRNNALKNGLLPVVVDSETHRRLFELQAANPDFELTVDLAAQTLRLPDGSTVTFPIDGFAKQCLLEGVDELGYLRSHLPAIEAFEARTPDAVRTI
jgi:3-isopropylmalate/(R)-2-methylmalate dehydratase small subunit